MPATIEELRAQVERCRSEARFWKMMTGQVVLTSTLLLASVVGAVTLAGGEAVRAREEPTGVQRLTDEAPTGRDVGDRASLPRLRFPAV